ncbi:lysozyme [Citreimonas sp.]|uniref:lysozyme n=1 Tax=Citreimonas sp. TaxID=3036715 RepID=UPI00405A4B4F
MRRAAFVALWPVYVALMIASMTAHRVLFGTWSTLCARAAERDEPFWRRWRAVFDILLWLIEPDHCAACLRRTRRKEPGMKLLPDWKWILGNAWSSWLLIVAIVLSGLEVVLPLFEMSFARELFAPIMGTVTALALLARLLVQREGFGDDESGALRKRAIGGIAGSAVALATAVGFVGQWEGLRTEAYRDIVGVWTVCYGETKGVQAGDSYSEAECDAMLAREIVAYERALDRCLTAEVPVGMKIALVSWTYNVGPGAACSSTLVRKANAGDLQGACNELPRWNRAGGRVIRGLSNRRASERAMCHAALERRADA